MVIDILEVTNSTSNTIISIMELVTVTVTFGNGVFVVIITVTWEVIY